MYHYELSIRVAVTVCKDLGSPVELRRVMSRHVQFPAGIVQDVLKDDTLWVPILQKIRVEVLEAMVKYEQEQVIQGDDPSGRVL